MATEGNAPRDRSRTPRQSHSGIPLDRFDIWLREEGRIAAEAEAERRKEAKEAKKAAKEAKEAKEAAEREEEKRGAQEEFLAFLQSRFAEYKEAGWRFEQLRTGHDPFGDLIRNHGDGWMLTPNHKHYRSQDNWDPRKILEWGRTYYDKYLPTASPLAIRKQKAAIQFMLTQSCLLVKPNVKRKIYWLLQNKYKTFSRDIERVFGKIFKDLADRANGREAPATPPANVDRPSAEFFGNTFTWSWEWPVDARVAIACKYYMWNRADCELGENKGESIEASNRRILLIQMLLALKEEGDIQAFPNDDGSDILYRRPNSTTYILVQAPDDGAVHVFDRPKKTSKTTSKKHQQRIFALFRHFNSLITRQITLKDSSTAYARVGDVEELPEKEVMVEMQGDETAENKKMRKNIDVLQAHPELMEALTIQPKKKRPSLQEFVGWRTIITHRKRELTKAVFADALKIPVRRAKAVEEKAIKEIKKARDEHGDPKSKAEFHGGSWH